MAETVTKYIFHTPVCQNMDKPQYTNVLIMHTLKENDAIPITSQTKLGNGYRFCHCPNICMKSGNRII